MAIFYIVPESLEDFVITLTNFIKSFDAKLFEKPLPVTIRRSEAFENKGSCALEIKHKLFRWIGFKDEYAIYTKSNHMKQSLNIEYAAFCYAVHEVRHRFQLKNEDCFISPYFADKHKEYFNKRIFDYVHNQNLSKYGTNEDLFKREFDANILDSVIGYYCKHKNMDYDLVIELLQSNESNIISVLRKLN